MKEPIDTKRNLNYPLPPDNLLTMQFLKNGKVTYIVSKNIMNGVFTLFSISEDNKLTKRKTADTPTDFCEIYGLSDDETV